MHKTHPLQVARGSRTATPPLQEVLAVLDAVLETAELGMVLTAPTRFGKSSFIDELEARFSKSKSTVVMRSTMTTGHTKNWENQFYRRLRGEEEGVESLFPQQSPKKALLRHIENECDQLGTAEMMFALDEAQNLSLGQLDVLKELSESLLKMGYKPFTLLVGQPELLRLRDWLRSALRADIIQRFMLRTASLRGMKSAEDISALLRHTDNAVWPEKSGKTYTAHFAPGAWALGWRIEQEAEGLWLAFLLHATKLGVGADLEIGTQFVAQAQLSLLQAVGDAPARVRARQPLPAGSELLMSAVESSGFAESLRLGARPIDEGDPKDTQATLRWLRQTRQVR